MQSNPNFSNQPDSQNPYEQNSYEQPQQPPYTQYPQQAYPVQPPQQYYAQPSYPPTLPPQGKSKVGWVIGILVGTVLLCGIIGVAGAAFSGVFHIPNSTVVNNPGDTSSSSPAGNHKVGEDVKVNTNWTAKVLDVKTSTGSTYFKAKDGEVYFIVHISLKNTSAKTQSISSLLSFKLRDKDGQQYSQSLFSDAGNSPDGKVAANSPLAGFVAFEVPKTVHNFTLDFTPELLSNDMASWDLSI